MEIYPDTIVYVYTPAGVWTGGINCCHQLCHALRDCGINAYIMYFKTDEYTGAPCHENALIYNNPEAEYSIDEPHNIIITPETATPLLLAYKHARKAILWLSVNFYYISTYITNYHLTNYSLFEQDDDIYHISDCYYTKEHLAFFSVPDDRVFMQESYINKNLLILAKQMPKVQKQDIITVNPAKDWESTKRIISYYAKHGRVYAKFTALYDLSLNELADTYAKAKLHLDFGPFPGREYIPREASIFDMCVIMGKRGAANFYGDTPIPPDYKFSLHDDDLPAITRMIESCITDYDKRIADFAEYKAFSFDLERRCYEQARRNFIKI